MNEHIRDYYKSFIESNTIPQFAVFIKGYHGRLTFERGGGISFHPAVIAVHLVLSSKIQKYAKMVMRAIIKNRIPGASVFTELIEDRDRQDKLIDGSD